MKISQDDSAKELPANGGPNLGKRIATAVVLSILPIPFGYFHGTSVDCPSGSKYVDAQCGLSTFVGVLDGALISVVLLTLSVGTILIVWSRSRTRL